MVKTPSLSSFLSSFLSITIIIVSSISFIKQQGLRTPCVHETTHSFNDYDSEGGSLVLSRLQRDVHFVENIPPPSLTLFFIARDIK